MQINSASSSTPPVYNSPASQLARAGGQPGVASATSGVQASFSPQGLKLAEAGADKLGTAAHLATQGLGEIVTGTASAIVSEVGGALQTVASGAESVVTLAGLAGATVLGIKA